MPDRSSPGRGLLTRVRSRLAGLGIGRRPPPPGLGPAFSARYEEEWNELVEQVDNYTQRIGAAVVSTWEVGAAELGRVVKGRVDEKTLIDRYSDSLVPTLTPFRDLHQKCSGAMSRGYAAGVAANQVRAATGPVAAIVEGLGGAANEGWVKTVEYLDPLLALGADPAATRARCLAAGRELEAACRKAQGLLSGELDRIAERGSLWDGVCDPWDHWQAALSRDVEIILTKVYRDLVADMRAGLA
jgi:hypothetical protein